MSPRKKPSERRRKKRRRVPQERPTIAARHPKPWEPVKQDLVEWEPPFPPTASADERREVLRRIGEDAEGEFQVRYPTIQRWFAEYDAPYVLAFCMLYFLAHPEGIDLEAEGKLEVLPHYVELLQAFALMAPRSYSPKPLFADAGRLKRELMEVGKLMRLRLFNIPVGVTSREDIHKHHLRTEMMAHTAAVRNWAYHHQMRRITQEIARLIAPEFAGRHSVDPIRLMGVLFDLGEMAAERLNQHLRRVREFMRKDSHRKLVVAYAEAFPDTTPVRPEQADALWQQCGQDIWAFRSMFAAHADLRLVDVYTVTLADVVRIYGDASKSDALRTVFDRLSLAFGELANDPPEHFILANPVHSRPFIRLAPDRYFSAVHGIIPHLVSSSVSVFDTPDLTADRASRLRPSEGLGIRVPVGEKAADPSLECTYALEAAAADGLRRQECKPPLDEV